MIQSNAIVVIFGHMKATKKIGCVVPRGALQIAMGAKRNVRAPDVLVDCSNRPPKGNTCELPLVIVEVSCPDHEDETWESVRVCSTLASLKEIVVLTTDARKAQIFRRQPDGTWPEVPETIEGSRGVAIHCLDFSVPLTELYAGTVFA